LKGIAVFRDEAGWIQIYEEKGAYWEHDGNPLRPHALLTSGKHSNGFFNSRRVTPDFVRLREAASDLILCFIGAGGNIAAVDRVVGPQTGATLLAKFISEEIGRRRGRSCMWGSPAKAGEDTEKHMVFEDSNHTPQPSELVLICEDVMSTGGSIELTAQAIQACGAQYIPFVLVLVNRSGQKMVMDANVLSLITRTLPMWTADECPLCPQGSKSIPAKGPGEWARLNATY
jgi:orotate phosphoribosyltransferase